ncbi:MAG: hypothetical protein A2Y12_18505 [Planctomycetes bacterium GWF2_42_9]|nr:MAG: hypothetical protein A2Y12_18505 [Planctomycetes bacterium GWF2_42_9]
MEIAGFIIICKRLVVTAAEEMCGRAEVFSGWAGAVFNKVKSVSRKFFRGGLGGQNGHKSQVTSHKYKRVGGRFRGGTGFREVRKCLSAEVRKCLEKCSVLSARCEKMDSGFYIRIWNWDLGTGKKYMDFVLLSSL